MWEADEPRKPVRLGIGDDLSAVSVSELEAHIATLEAEIERVRAEVRAKNAHKKAASAAFKLPET